MIQVKMQEFYGYPGGVPLRTALGGEGLKPNLLVGAAPEAQSGLPYLKSVTRHIQVCRNPGKARAEETGRD